MICVPKYDKNGEQRISICTSCNYNAQSGICHGHDLWVKNEWKRQRATIYRDPGCIKIEEFTNECLEPGEFLKWCEKNGFRDAKCPEMEVKK